MAGNQPNFDNLLYVDNNGVSWTKRGEVLGAATAVDGHAAGASAPTWIDSKRMRVRRILYQEPVSFRTVQPIFYTAAAWAAVALGDLIAVPVQGVAASVNFSAVRKLSEKQPGRGGSRKLADIP